MLNTIKLKLKKSNPISIKELIEKGEKGEAGGIKLKPFYQRDYKFNEEETDTVGIYKGEFKVTFSNGDYIILPIQDELYIHIKDSFIQ